MELQYMVESCMLHSLLGLLRM